MRCFLAIDLPEDARRHLERVRRRLVDALEVADAVAWVKPQNWHLTLKFLGDVDERRIHELAQQLADVRVEPMQLAAERMVYFPKRGPVRVVAVGLGGDVAQLVELYEQVERACVAAGFKREGREYTPHVTFGRVRGRGKGVTIRALEVDRHFPGPTFSIDTFALWQSELHPQGARHFKLAMFPAEGG